MNATHPSTAVKITGLDLAGAMVTNPQRAIAFYRDVLGLEPTMIDDQGRGAEFTLADGSTFGVWKAQPAQKTPCAAMMFAVRDVKAAVEFYRGRGLELSDVIETPVCYMAYAEDPEGNAVIIHQRKA
jgi:predicted enzyme related to lactoylglutathione lyase